ncbi:NADP-dependent oxidoreductase domain-containing protein [Naematelia encephala]|uniref:NADP-dependent oxidoreductase domain-containing protein n=1 Tax=Naematelia encephala TaxID=71784 RepID=A0A1Y2ASH2_9TREE|nr:NADP-dependent oxidoreductase domain-containing protein [Naematelia encephala]
MVRNIALNNGKTIPSLAWGNMGGKAKALKAGAIALKAGIHHIDSAQIYGTEAEVNGAIQAAGVKRDDVFVTTKLWKFTEPTIGLEEIKASVQRSLAELTFIPDLLLVHNPYIPEKGKIGEFWKHLETLVEDGTLKGCSLGVSNFRPVDIEEVFKTAKIKPVVNQIEYHPYVLEHLEPLLKVHAKYSIVTQSYATLSPVARHPTGGPIKPILTRLAATLSKESGETVDEAGVLILWAVSKGVVVITSSGDEGRIKKMAATERVRDLSSEEIEEIDQAGRKIHFRVWDEHMTNEFPDPDLPTDI